MRFVVLIFVDEPANGDSLLSLCLLRKRTFFDELMSYTTFTDSDIFKLS